MILGGLNLVQCNKPHELTWVFQERSNEGTCLTRRYLGQDRNGAAQHALTVTIQEFQDSGNDLWTQFAQAAACGVGIGPGQRLDQHFHGSHVTQLAKCDQRVVANSLVWIGG